MSAAKKLFKGAATLLAGHGASQILGFVRNFAVARLVAPEDFGVAAAFAAILSMLEAASDLAWDKLLIQARNGEDPELMANMHLLTVMRGGLLAVVLFLAAGPLARAFDVPEAETAFAWLALVPALRGFSHMDIKRLQRGLRFGPEVMVSLAAQATGMVVAIGLAWLLQDYRAMLWGLVAQSAVQVAVSQLLAQRSYRLGWRLDRMRQILIFGWPLLLNGLVIVATAQGDRLLVGAKIGVYELALYAAAAMLFEAVRTMISKVVGGVALPWLSAVQDAPETLRRRYLVFITIISGAMLAFFLPFVLFGGLVVSLVFGSDYLVPATLAGALAFASAIRFLRGAVVVAALALGDTKSILIANIARTTGLVAAVVWLAQGAGATEVAVAMLGGELLALAFSLTRLRRFPDLQIKRSFVTLMLPLIIMSGAMITVTFVEPGAALLELIIGGSIVFVVACVSLLALCPLLLTEARRLLASR